MKAKEEKNKGRTFNLFLMLVVFLTFYFIFLTQQVVCPAFSSQGKNPKLTLSLPPPRKKGDVSLEEAISRRISRREYKKIKLL